MTTSRSPRPHLSWNGEYYSRHSEWQLYVAKKALEHIDLPPKAKILDVGCGDGGVTSYLAELVPYAKILGIDPSPSMLSTAKTRAGGNLSFALGDARTLPFTNQFDRIVAFNSLHWVPEISSALERIEKALAPGGKALILVAPTQVRHVLHQVIEGVAKSQNWCDYFDDNSSLFSFYTLATWATLLESCKMIPERLQFIDASFEYPSVQAFADSLASWIPFGRIPDEKKGEFINDIVRAYLLNIPSSSEGNVMYCLDELVIVASKPTI